VKICYLADASIIHSRRWAGWFAAHGHEVLLINTTGECPDIPGVRIVHLAGKQDLPLIKWFSWSVRVSRILRQWHPDIVHVHQLTGAGWLGAGIQFHPMILTPWGSDLYLFPDRSPLHAWLTRQVIHHADYLTANSEHLAQEACKYGADPARIKTIQWEVNRQVYFPRSESAIEHRTSPAALISLRAISPLYNQHIILEAFSAVLRDFPNTRLILQDYSSDPLYKASLEQHISRLAIGEAVQWVGPASSESEIAERIRSAEIGISVPSSDSAPVSVLEALACGVPVIASDLPAVRELIGDGENGLLVPPGDAKLLYQAMLELLQDPDRRRKLREGALRRITVRPEQEAEMTRLEHLYESLAQNKKDHQ